jgi:hypothetical protein
MTDHDADDVPSELLSDEPGGGRLVRWGVIAVVGMGILVLLFTVVFPWIERNLSTPTLGG